MSLNFRSAFDCTGGTNHAGADWTPTNGSTVSGIHCNIGTFSIPTGYTVYTTAGDIFKVSANTISIVGTLTADVKGYAGGSGGAGGIRSPLTPASNGLSGTNTGSYGGAGGAGGAGGTSSGYVSGGAGGTSSGTIRGDASSKSIDMGGGAGGGGGGGTAGSITVGPGGAGNSGQNGGGAMFLYGNTISISGTISANGGVGGNGGNGTSEPNVGGGGGGGGAGGSGGGILIDGASIVVTGTVRANGGNGGLGGSALFTGLPGSPGNQGGGGRIKIFYRTINTAGSTITSSGFNNGTVYTQLSTYLSSGAFTSTNLLSGQSVGPISSFSYNLSSLPAGTTAKVSFSQDNANWYNSAGTASGWDTMSAGSNSISLSALNWTGANFYYKMEWTSTGAATPVLDEVSVHTNYPSSGAYTSSARDTGIDSPSYLNLAWSADSSGAYFSYRKAITLNNSGSALTDYQVLVTLDTAALISAGKMRSDCGDIRFYDSGGSALNYWLESGCNSTSTKVWVKVPSIPIGASAIYFLYGNSSATSASSGANTFAFFDDFSGGNYAGWTVAVSQTGDSASAASGKLVMTKGATAGNFQLARNTTNQITEKMIWEVKMSEGVTTANFKLNGDNSGTLADGAIYLSLQNTYFYYYTGAWNILTDRLTNGATYRIVIIPDVSTDKFDIYVYNEDGSEVQYMSGPFPTNHTNLNFYYPTTYLNEIRSSVYSGNNIGNYDNILVRKYTMAEPTASAGTEESGSYFGGGTSVKFQIRSASTEGGISSATWYGPTGTTDYYTTSGTAINSIHNGDRWVQYKAILETTDPTQTPALHSADISFGMSSTLTSSPYDASDSGEVISSISWTEIAPTGTNAKFQMRTAPESSGTYTIWMGPDGTASAYFDNDSLGCLKTGSDVTCDVSPTLGISDGVNDRWLQYKVWLTSGVAETPILQNVDIQYVVNATPVVSNVTASQGADGAVSISYNLSDEDSSSFTVSALAYIGVALNEELTSSDATAITVSDGSLLPSSGTIQIDNEQISYTSKSGNNLQGTITRAANNTKALSHSSGTVVWIKGSTVTGNVGASQIAGTGKSISWTIKTDLNGVYYPTAKIRVSANDGNAANQVGNGDSTAFVLDTKDVVLGANPILIDGSGGLSSTVLTLTATDDTALEMKLSNNADLSADGVNTDSGTWISYASAKSWILSTDPDTVYVQFKDSKGNTTATQSLESLLMPEYFMIQDTSNLDAGEFREFAAWKASAIDSFLNYTLEYSTSASSYETLTTITNQALNYYTHTSLIQDQDYYYRVYQRDTLGNKSPRTAAKHGNANGAQDFDEGGGGTAAGVDAIAPVITHDYATQITNIASTTVAITFTADEMSDSYIGYSTGTGYANEQGAPTMIAGGEAHTVTLVGLIENTAYHYKIKSRDISGNVGSSQDDVNYVFTTITDTTAPVIAFTSSTDITSITDSSAIISWTTNEAATSRVDYGTSVSYGSNEANGNYNFDHSITLSGLLPATTYYFKITSVDGSISANSATSDNSGAGYTFTTLASSDTTPPTISAVSSGTPSYNTAIITWTTNENGNSLVDFGTAVSYGKTQGNSSDSTISHSVTLVGLASSTTYYYRVKSMDVSGNIATDDNSGTGYIFTTTSAPDPGDTTPPVISAVSSSSITFNSATISWTTDENSDSTVGFSLNTSFNQEQGSTTATTSHSITLVNLAPETTYYYQVKSRDGGGNLRMDNNGGVGYTFTTLAGGDELAPIISDVAISDITANTAKITWTTNENSNSLIDYSGTTGVFTSTTGKYQDNTTAHSVTLTGLDPSTAYYIQARSTDGSSNEGKDSNGGTGWTFTTTAGGDETPPEITAVLAGTATYNSVTITWTTNELSNSLVDFGISTSYGTTQGNSADSVTFHSVTLTGLAPTTAYYYRVKSIDVSGNLASDDNSGAGWTFTTAAGADPGDTTATVITFNSETGITNITSNSATVSWTTDESSDSTIGYSLDTSFNLEKGSATLTTSHSVILTNLSSGTAYKFQIKSMDSSGNLATENNSGAGYAFTTLTGGDSTPPVISNVASGTCTDTTVIITWTTDENSSSLVDYGTVLGTYTSTGGNYKASVTSHSVTLTGLTAETKYYYRVRSIDANGNQALDAGGASGYSFTTAKTAASTCPTCSCGGGGGSCPSVDTNPPTISNVKVSAITINSAVVKWETNEKSYSLAEYGPDNSYGSTNGSATANTTNHTVSLTKLDENTTYHYRVLSADSSGNLAQSKDFTFKTLALEELTPKEQEKEIKEQHKTAAVEIQTKLEELLAQGMDEEEIRNIIAKATQSPSISTEGPIVENITNNSAKIIWVTDRKSNSVIRFKVKEEGADPETSLFLKQYGNFKELAIEHQVILSGLQSGTNYQYQVQSSDILGNTGKSEWREFATEVTPSIYDVIISEITLNSAVISWKTNVVSTSKVEYGETINYTDSAEDKDPAKVAKHSIKLNNLKSGTLYHFRVRGIGGEGSSLVSDDYSFTTFTLPQIETYQIEEIDERTIKLSWKTNVETDSVLKYTDLETNDTKTQGEDGMSSIHNFTLKGLNPGIEYLLQIQGRDIYGNQAITSEFAATTLADSTSPQITQVRTETAVSSGKSDVVQTIISWKTSEPATSQILWEEGISENGVPKNATQEDENYTTNHITVITTFKPASVYRFRIQGKDKSGNSAQSSDFTILIPEKKKSVIQIIISNFENTFGWVKKIGL